jgi:LacI family transcriptional regulator
VAYNDLLAIGALQACRREGLRVPEDVAIIGVDDTEMAAVTDPPLSTIRQHQYQLGAHAVALLLTLLDARSTAASEALARNSLPLPDLVVRRSSSLRAPSVASPEEIDGHP